MFPVLQVGPAAIQMPGLLIILGVWVAFLITEREARRLQLEANIISNAFFYSLVAALIGARLGYALQFLDLYLNEPIEFVALNMNTLSLPEGLLAGALVGIIYGYRKGLPLLPTLDAITPGLAVFLIFLAVAHLSSGDAFGNVSTAPWAIELWGARRHPTQVYGVVASVIILLLLLRIRRDSPFPGFVFLIFIILTSASRLFLEIFRGDSVLLMETLRRDQILYLSILAAGLIGLGMLARRVSDQRPQ